MSWKRDNQPRSTTSLTTRTSRCTPSINLRRRLWISRVRSRSCCPMASRMSSTPWSVNHPRCTIYKARAKTVCFGKCKGRWIWISKIPSTQNPTRLGSKAWSQPASRQPWQTRGVRRSSWMMCLILRKIPQWVHHVTPLWVRSTAMADSTTLCSSPKISHHQRETSTA